MIRALYVHVPFCLRKCNYCDFYSLPVQGKAALFSRYPLLLEGELALWQEKEDLSGLATVYFGGGTPSLLEPAAVAHFLQKLPAAPEEITLEANPETLDRDKLAAFRAAGVNRLSLGAQSFHPARLGEMGRGHTPDQTRAALENARAAGFRNIGLDLIYGLPGQTPEEWAADLEQTLALEPEHISLYGLTVSRECPWGRAGVAPLDDDGQADLVEMAMDRLARAGFRHYEIANFAKPGYASRHNTAYWQRENYLGLGPAAASCIAAHRWVNLADLDAWAAALENGKLPLAADETLTIDQVIAEGMFLGLRLRDGIDCAAFLVQYGVDPRKRFRQEVARMEKLGLLEEEAGRLRLTRKGLMLGDDVFAAFV